jgi:ERCC4-related helicase
LQQTEPDNKWFRWSNFFACVFDEVHHVLKEHPYRVIAHSIKAWEENQKHRIQVVGLSASLTYAVEHKAVEQALANLCYDLSISKMISPTEEELKKSGYIPQDDSIETMHKPWVVPDGVMPGKCDRAIVCHEMSLISRVRFL